MRCKACDALLTDVEVSLKSEIFNDYLDMCLHCLSYIPSVGIYNNNRGEAEDDASNIRSLERESD